jgi:hypothetical protein
MNNATRKVPKFSSLLLERCKSFVKVKNGPFPEQQALLISVLLARAHTHPGENKKHTEPI